MERQSGTTTGQMLKADVGSYYVIPDGRDYGYYVNLSESLGRTDLSILRLHQVEHKHKVYGLDIKFPVVVDHACVLTERHKECLKELEYRYNGDKSKEKYMEIIEDQDISKWVYQPDPLKGLAIMQIVFLLAGTLVLLTGNTWYN